MKIKGNMGKATKFTPDLFPPPTPENIAKYLPAKLWKIFFALLLENKLIVFNFFVMFIFYKVILKI